MNWDRVKGDWKIFKGKIKEKWGDLTDDDIDMIEASVSNWSVASRNRTALRVMKQIGRFRILRPKPIVLNAPINLIR